ncbi:MAG: prohibitin family protein [Dehalococcoidia bacterium]|nr:prohibitin family protein [Dehalococcoidia bacterium]
MLLLTNILGFQTLGLIGPGERGVVLQFNAVTDKTFSEGLYAKVPFVESVVKMSVQTLAYEVDAGAASRDLQEVATGVTLNYSLAPDKVNRIYQQLRRDYVERIIKPAVQESVKATTAQFDAEELISKRPAVRAAIEDTLKQRISPFGITVDALSITNFQFSPTFTASIEAKVVAVQKALEAENRLRQIEIEARQREATAVGEANAILRVAEAQASANALVNKTLTADLIQFTLVQKLGDQIKVIMLPSNQPFILGSDWLAAEGK